MKSKKTIKEANWKKRAVLGVVVFLVGFGMGWTWESEKFDFGGFWRKGGYGGKELEVDLPKTSRIEGYVLSERKDIDKDGVAEGLAIFYETEEKEMVNFYPISFGLFEFKGKGDGWQLVFEKKINDYWGREFPLEEIRFFNKFETVDLTGNGKEEVVVKTEREEGSKKVLDVWIFGVSEEVFGELGGWEGLREKRVRVVGKRLVIGEVGLVREKYFEFKNGRFTEVFDREGEVIGAKDLLIGSSKEQIFAFDTMSGEKVLKTKVGEIKGADYSSLAKMLIWVERKKGKRGFFDEIWSQDLVKGAKPREIIGGESMEEEKDFYDPKISPDGRKLAFKAGGVAYTALYVADTDGTGARKIVEQGDYGIGEYSWTRDSKELVYFTETVLLEEPTPSNQLKVVNVDNGEERILTKNVYTTCGEPVEVQGVVFYSASNGKRDLSCSLIQIRKDGSGEEVVRQQEGEKRVNDLVGSKEGKYIAFIVNEEFEKKKQGEIHVLKVSEGESVLEKFLGGQPKISPDENFLAFVRGGVVYKLDLEKGGIEKVKGLTANRIWDWE